jgi:hypothetical protein
MVVMLGDGVDDRLCYTWSSDRVYVLRLILGRLRSLNLGVEGKISREESSELIVGVHS